MSSSADARSGSAPGGSIDDSETAEGDSEVGVYAYLVGWSPPLQPIHVFGARLTFSQNKSGWCVNERAARPKSNRGLPGQHHGYQASSNSLEDEYRGNHLPRAQQWSRRWKLSEGGEGWLICALDINRYNVGKPCHG